MNVKEKLDFLSMAEDFVVTKYEDGDNVWYRIDSESSDLCCFIRGSQTTFCVSGVYNSGQDLVDIDLEDLKKLQKFVKFLTDEGDKTSQ